MKILIVRHFLLLTVLCGISIPAAAEDLDTALAEQKKKAQRRIYSDYAQIDDQNLTVPVGKTEQEKKLDKKLEEINLLAEETARSLPNQLMARAQYSAQRVQPSVKENRNWLTDAVLNEKKSEAVPTATDNDWLAQEAARRKSLDSTEKEAKTVERLLRGESRLQTAPADLNFKNFQVGQQSLTGGKNPFSTESLFALPKAETPDSSVSFNLTSQKKTTPAPPLFPPQTVRQPSSFSQNPFQSSLNRLNNPAQNAPSGSGLSPAFYSGLNSTPAAPLNPLQKIKSASPINQSDPFSNNQMPKIKSSIWD
ncbi:MAG: hypothetical protein MUC65_03800 [Pontiellaceae bacterium]|jgi:hypothetical protein|nr:hypothetical protein [Pontiellaceae bacterium]